jgi:hypothetical protein
MLYHCLNGARAHHIGQSPPGKWQKSFPRSGCNDQLAVPKLRYAQGCLGQQDTAFELIKDAGSEKDVDPGTLECLEPPYRLGNRDSSRTRSPNLPARMKIVIDRANAQPAFCG